MFSENNAAAGVTFPRGFKAAGVKAGIKNSGNLDVAMIYTEKTAAIAGVFTKNAVAAAPVLVSKEVVKTGTAHAIVANAGCANACTGQTGLDNAHKMAAMAAAELGCDASDVCVGSTGIIGVNLPMDKMEAGRMAASMLAMQLLLLIHIQRHAPSLRKSAARRFVLVLLLRALA